ncbi:uncharacterized protein LOC144918606 isoform X2 [Branchiostoma floridae x Branchiostoma belcheri]
MPSKDCYSAKAFFKALSSLLSYLNGENEDGVNIDMNRPLYAGGFVDAGEKKCYLVTLLPEKFSDNPPRPINDKITFDRVEEGKSRYFQVMHKGKYVEAEIRQRFRELMEELDNLKPFGVQADLNEGSKDEISTKADNKEDVKEVPSHEKMSLPKPAACSKYVCRTVYVTKNHSNFMELLIPSHRSVCHQTKLCGGLQVSGRQLMRPILGYLNGDNSAKEKISNFAGPFFRTRLYSAEEEEKGIPPCEREYQACVTLPDDYKEIPKPNGKGLGIFSAPNDFRGYGIAVKGYVSEPVASEAISTLMQTLDEENVPYDNLKTWVASFSYYRSFTNPEEKVTYFIVNERGEDIVEEPTDGNSNETEN